MRIQNVGDPFYSFSAPNPNFLGDVPTRPNFHKPQVLYQKACQLGPILARNTRIHLTFYQPESANQSLRRSKAVLGGYQNEGQIPSGDPPGYISTYLSVLKISKNRFWNITVVFKSKVKSKEPTKEPAVLRRFFLENCRFLEVFERTQNQTETGPKSMYRRR